LSDTARRAGPAWQHAVAAWLYEHLVISFGLTNAPTHFMYLINSVFMSELDKFIVVFIDNMLVYSKSTKDHEEHL
jgi:hypothetical protein